MLFKKKDKNTAPKKEIVSNANENKVLDSDFVYIQKDKKIHDVNFSGKPTTFFGDAMRRFVKNKSSVVASVILLTLVGMAIIVPFANGNDIETNVDSSKYLPPKWFEVNGSGFMDGTKNVTDIPCYNNAGKAMSDDTPNSELTPNEYLLSAIIGDMNVKTISSPYSSPYGYGGYVSLKPNTHTSNAVYSSTKGTWNNDKSYDFTLNYDFNGDLINQENAGKVSSSYRILANVYFNGDKESATTAVLKDWSTDFGTNTITNLNTLMKSAYVGENPIGSSYSASFSIELKTVDDTVSLYPSLFIKNFYISSTAAEEEAKTVSITKLGFTDANELLTRGNSDIAATKARAWTWRGANNPGAKDIHQKTASFRYDCYAAAFGEDSYTFTSNDVQSFIDKGYMTYTWTNKKGQATTPGEFHLTELGETYCPIREVKSQTYDTHFGVEQKELNCTRSLYRYDYYKGYITKCESPKYFFGTDHYGHDFFKLAFSGLLTSLGLGFFASLINITIGLIWGAISGYFGGWTDMIMERFTEILGGMPWIVVMTLIVLFLGSNFWTFLLALCLTGWIGMSSETRSQFYRFKGREYVLASRTLGASDGRLIFKHILPNGIGTIITSAILMIPSVIFTEANISYLLPGTLAFSGSQSFGITLSNAQADIQYYPYLIVSVSIVMILLMISFNLFGNGLRDAFNPSLKGSDN